MGLIDYDYQDGQTPLDEDEKDGLRIATLTLRSELDEVEQRNIEKALQWVLKRRARFSVNDVLSEQFVKDLHKKMYGEVWKWAGEFRKTNKNIGVDKFQIGIELKALLDDCKYWITQETFPQDEIALRFKHRLVSIHCFPNGNGRHSRLMADIIVEKLFGREVFSWGRRNLNAIGKERDAYLHAVRQADQGDLTFLIEFSRS